MSTLRIAPLILGALSLAACAALSPYPERPQVNITSFDISPTSSGIAPRFNIGVQVINPNRRALPLQGMTYTVEVDGTRILSGATGNLPTVPAYGMSDFVIEVSPDLLGSARLIADLSAGRQDSLRYSFKARLDVGRWMPYISVEESGTFQMRATR